ncbi:MAG: type I DNA topoisomerase [Chloroflexi bacterium]|nr:type I DNA topoisomerase [Chloroflexota bacterium]MDA1218695.1 type I DNA topoisomerase [Chloroflexota bacterium]
MVTKTTTKAPAKAKTAKAATTKAKATTIKTTKAKAAAKKKVASLKTAGKRFVIVESPAKARTVGQILGNKYVVTASQGHVRDLPKGKMGVDFENDFEPSYVTMKEKRSLLTELKKAGDAATEIYLATDPDREGEAISWHIQTAAGWDTRPNPPKRVVFHEITKQAVEEAFQHPREIDMQMVNAQQARRILDRLVGYQLSPLLWRRVQRGLSAGRVQSVSLRMVTDREKEIAAFVPVESWTIDATLHKQTDPADKPETFTATLHSLKGAKGRLGIAKEDEARNYEAELEDAAYAVADVKKRDVRLRPTAPFTTSTMQQEAGRKLRFTAQRTMMIAQQLYEGISVPGEGSVGLITYMRTDSVQVAQTAIDEARDYIRERYGKEYLPDKTRVYKTKAKSAQEAHEAIRPTSIRRDPEKLKDSLTSEQHRLYSLVWSRMLSSQMADARTEATTVDIEASCKQSPNVYLFRATGSVLKFPGFRTLYLESRDDGEDDDHRKLLPALASGDGLNCLKLEPLQHFTQPPPRFTEATLIKAMEERGIGRPSTYAPTIGTLIDRNYVEKDQTRLTPTELGITVTDLLTEYFTTVMDLDFTARMEDELDEVSQGEREWVPMLREFYGPFEKALESAQENMPNVKFDEETDEICETCGKPMVIKAGRFGKFIACTGFPECRTTKPILKRIGIACPKCGGDIVERRSRGRRRPFYGCSKYPECDLILNKLPVAEPCPECGGLMVSEAQDGSLSCTNCVWKGDPVEVPAMAPTDQEPELAPVGD